MSVTPHRPKGPPLNAMRAFESAARLESFVAAAEELSVTPGAVSQHIKTLEGWAGTSLFQRNAQGVELTPAGRALVPVFIKAFDAIGAATHDLRNLQAITEIHIAALPCVAQLWLPTRLAKIRRQYPHVEFSVTAMETPPNLARELFDMSLFFEAPNDDPDQIKLLQDQIMPVCAPELADQIDGPDKLNEIALLQDQTWQDDWTVWSELSSVRLTDPKNGPRYSLYSLAVEEAKSGAGVLMGHLCLISEAMQAGALVPAFPVPYKIERSLVLQLPHPSRRTIEIEEIAKLLQG